MHAHAENNMLPIFPKLGTYKCRLPYYRDGQEDHQHSVNVTFHKLGIGGQNKDTGDGLKLRTLGAIRSMLGHEKVSHLNDIYIEVAKCKPEDQWSCKRSLDI